VADRPVTQPAEVTVSKRCEHGSFTVQIGTASVWHLPGPGRIETAAEDLFVFHPDDWLCPCWSYDESWEDE
jgi:hypothetical protein